MRHWVGLLLLLVCGLSACGGGGGGGSSSSSTTSGSPTTIASNGVDSIPIQIAQFSGTQTITANMPYVTVTICDTANTCASVPNVLLDTGSTGLRLTASAVTNTGLNLAAITTSGSNVLAECAYFASGYLWGGIRQATVKLGQTATSAPIPIQVIADSTSTSTMQSLGSQKCPTYVTPSNLASSLYANGILGIGNAIDDGSSGNFYSCSNSSCSSTSVSGYASASSLGSKPITPVVAFSANYNKGVIVQMPSVAAAGATTATGALVLGINTTSNNQMANGTQYYGLNSSGYLTVAVTLNGTSNSRNGFLDTGSNGYFLTLGSTQPCTGNSSGFYCPTSPVSFTLQVSSSSTGANSGTLSATIANANTLFQQTGYTALPELGGPYTGSVDLGLPFFYGRSVAVGLENISLNSTTYTYGMVAF